MSQLKFLYGAAVQGIQGFIFQTNALMEISGASELVEQICTSQFANAIGCNEEVLAKDQNAIVTAAGNIKYVFEDELKLKELIRKFPMKVMEFAPGITISQAVVKIEDGKISKGHIDELERRLRAQRNKTLRPFDIGLMSMNRSRKTGFPAVEEKNIKGELTIIDAGTIAKISIQSKRVLTSMLGKIKDASIPWYMEDITKSLNESYSWLAVIHADGNNMGVMLHKLGEYAQKTKGQHFITLFRDFSKSLDLATKEAAKHAYLETVKNIALKPKGIIPFRPIIVGGDDLTIVCRGDIALQFTKLFLRFFEEKTKEHLKSLAEKVNFLENGLTACAGIAYIKESYPFHYGYTLAETLCGEAKKAAKKGLDIDEITPSCLMFHKVQDSFVEDYKSIRERELEAGNIRLDFGPYYLENHTKTATIDQLEDNVLKLEGKEGNAIKSHLRQWLTDLHNEPKLAEQKLNRLISVIPEAENLELPNSAIQNGKSPVYDWLTIHSINQIKEENND